MAPFCNYCNEPFEHSAEWIAAGPPGRGFHGGFCSEQCCKEYDMYMAEQEHDAQEAELAYDEWQREESRRRDPEYMPGGWR